MFLDRYVQSFINRSKNGKISTPHHNKKKKKKKEKKKKNENTTKKKKKKKGKKKKELQFENLKILLLPIL